MRCAGKRSRAISGYIIQSPAPSRGRTLAAMPSRSCSHWSASMMAARTGKSFTPTGKPRWTLGCPATLASRRFVNWSRRAFSALSRRVTSTAKSDTQPCGDTLGKPRRASVDRPANSKSGSLIAQKPRAQKLTRTGAKIEPTNDFHALTGPIIAPDNPPNPQKCVRAIGSIIEPQVVYQQGDFS